MRAEIIAIVLLCCAVPSAVQAGATWVEAKEDEVAYVARKRWLRRPAGYVGAVQGPHRKWYPPRDNRYFHRITKAWVMRSETSSSAVTADGTTLAFTVNITVRPRVAPEYPGWAENVKALVDTYAASRVELRNSDSPEARSPWYDHVIKSTLRGYIDEEVGMYPTLELVQNLELIGRTLECRVRNFLGGNENNVNSYNPFNGTCDLRQASAGLFDVQSINVDKISLPEAIQTSVVKEVARSYDTRIAEEEVKIAEVRAQVRAVEAEQETTKASLQTSLTPLFLRYHKLRTLFNNLECNAQTQIYLQLDLNGVPSAAMVNGSSVDLTGGQP